MATPITIDDLQGGIADDHVAALKPNQVALAWNVDFWDSNVASRRHGTSDFKTAVGVILGLFHHTPTSTSTEDLLVAVNSTGTWRTFTTPAGTLATLTPSPADTFTPVPGVDAVSLHGKLFIASDNSSPTRLHVYDGTTLRRTGLTTPVGNGINNISDTAVAGTYGTVRYVRIRWVTLSGSVVIRRSEPSTSAAYTPSGTKTGLIITPVAAPGDGETHWELEMSLDNANFYRLATTAAGSAYTDTTAATAIATTGTLSEDIGDYTNLPSARWLAVDNDRLIYGGDHESPALDARVGWTPLSVATGVGNDERIPLDNANYIDCDGRNSGGLTGLKAFEGKLIAFKANQIHTLVRAGTNGSAYLPAGVVRSKGAMKFSVVEGFDAEGRAALYFIDPASGPAAMGGTGIITLAPQLTRTWKTAVNVLATVRVCSAVYYADKQQVWWHLATGASNYPDTRWVYHTRTGGFTFHTVPDSAACSAVMWNPGTGSKPYVGLTNSIAACDDASATTDSSTNYRAYVRTRAYTLSGLIKKGGVATGVIEADAASGVTVTIGLIRDYGAETIPVTALLTASGTETVVIVPMDDATISETKVVQFEIGDAIARSVAAWNIHRLVFEVRSEGRT